MSRPLTSILAALALVTCYRQARPNLPDLDLVTSEGRPWALRANISKARFTVFEFFSADCVVQRAHDRRLIDLHERYNAQGVQVILVDSEAGAAPERDALERRSRGYPFPLLIDAQNKLADALGANYSTYCVILDREGNVHYQGGIDSARRDPGSESVPYLRLALDELLRGAEPRHPTSKAFGCVLRKW